MLDYQWAGGRTKVWAAVLEGLEEHPKLLGNLLKLLGWRSSLGIDSAVRQIKIP